MEIVYAVLMTVSFATGTPVFTQATPHEEMTINQCLKDAREINYSSNTEYVLACVPKKEAPRES